MASVQHEKEIKTMLLYSDIDRIWGDLASEGYQREDLNGTIPVEAVNKYDCYNYGGPSSAKAAATKLGLTENSKLLDVGSGIGGPARCISSFSGTHVTAVELQKDLVDLQDHLNRKCGLGTKITSVAGDFCDDSVVLGDDNSFDGAVSWLVILHIPLSDREKLFSRVFKLLKSGAKMYIEDYYRNDELTEREKELLSKQVYVPHGQLPTHTEYEDLLKSVGFHVDFEEATDEWRAFTSARLQTFHSLKARHIEVWNEATYNHLDTFYSSVVELFSGKNLGGAKIIITKP